MPEAIWAHCRGSSAAKPSKFFRDPIGPWRVPCYHDIQLRFVFGLHLELAAPADMGTSSQRPLARDDEEEEQMRLVNITRGLSTGVAAAAIVLCAQAVSANENFGSLQGVVKSAAGQPVSGAFVRLKNAEKRLTFMVISQNGGAFTAADLPAGNYTVQAIEGKNQSAVSAPVAVSAGKAAKLDPVVALRYE